MVFASSLDLVVVVSELWHGVLETLSLSYVHDDLVRAAAFFKRISVDSLPVREDHLREGLTRGVGTKKVGETEGLQDRKEGLDLHERGTRALDGFLDHTTTLIESGIHTSDGVLRNCDITHVERFHESRTRLELTSVDASLCGGHDLTSTTVNGIGVHDDIDQVDSDTTHGFLAENTGASGLLEGILHGIGNFSEILDTLGAIDQNVGGTVRRHTKGPDLTGLTDIPTELVSEHAATHLLVTIFLDITSFDGIDELFIELLSIEVDTVVLVGGLGHTGHSRFHGDSFLEGHNRVGNDNRGSLHKVFSEILNANLQVKFTGTGNNVFTSGSSEAQDQRIGLGKTLETFHKLGEIRGVLNFDGDTHNRRHRVLHGDKAVGLSVVGDSTRLEKVLVNTDETDDVTTRAIGKLFDVTTHHENGTLNLLDVKIGLLAWDVVRTHDTDGGTSGDLTGEHTTESVEASLFGGRNHLGDVHHERTVLVASTDTLGARIVHGTGVQVLDTVSLGDGRGRKVVDNHLEKSIGGREPDTHEGLEERLASKVLGFLGENNGELFDHGGDDIILSIHDGGTESSHRLHDELAETTLELLTVRGELLGSPLLLVRVEVVGAPQSLHDLVHGKTPFCGVEFGELTDSETPRVETRTETDSSLFGVNLDVTEEFVVVSGNDDIDGLDGTRKQLVAVFRFHHELEENAVKLVHEEDGLDTLGNGLTKHSLGLDTDTFDAVDDDKGTIGDTEGSSDLGRKVNVSGRVDQVDQKVSLLDILLGNGLCRSRGGGLLLLLLLSLLSLSGLLGSSAILLHVKGVESAVSKGKVQ